MTVVEAQASTRSDRNAAFRRGIDDAKTRKNLSDVVSRRTKLRRRGREMVGLCPFHDEKTPSFEVNDAKGFYHCHGCGQSGDHFSFLMKADGLSFREAFEALTGDTFPSVDPAERARQLAEDAAIRGAAIEDAQQMYARCGSIVGTSGEVYLRDVRGIRDIPSLVRFGRVPASRDDNGHWKRPWPAIVLPVHHEVHGIIGLQRIFIADDGSGKRWGKASKLSLGRPRGGAVRLGPARDEVVICEGPEDGLTLAQELRDQSIWVALGTAMIPEIEYPTSVSSVVLAGQNDKPGIAAVEKAELALLERGFAVRTMWPTSGYKDWNDMLRDIRS